MAPLFGVTNSTGYVVFQNVPTGNYTFRIVKEGYYNTSQRINLKETPIALTLTLTSLTNASKSAGSGGSSLPTILIAAVIAVVAVVAVVLVVKRRGSKAPEAPNSQY